MTTRGVRISLVEPGTVATELTDHITHDSTRDLVKGTIAASTPMQPEDIARAIVYIVSQPPYVAVNEMLIRPTDQER